jgi:hypothetical protein
VIAAGVLLLLAVEPTLPADAPQEGRPHPSVEEALAGRPNPARPAAHQLLRGGDDEPPLDILREAAVAMAMAEPRRARSLVARARQAAWLPEVRFLVNRRFGRSESLEYGGAPADVVPPPVGLDTVDDVRYEGRATWDLSRIVFNPDELSAQAQALRMADVRREIESVVIRLYFERRRLKAEGHYSDGTDGAGEVRRELRRQELAAELDALTGGAFSRKPKTTIIINSDTLPSP